MYLMFMMYSFSQKSIYNFFLCFEKKIKNQLGLVMVMLLFFNLPLFLKLIKIYKIFNTSYVLFFNNTIIQMFSLVLFFIFLLFGQKSAQKIICVRKKRIWPCSQINDSAGMTLFHVEWIFQRLECN